MAQEEQDQSNSEERVQDEATMGSDNHSGAAADATEADELSAQPETAEEGVASDQAGAATKSGEEPLASLQWQVVLLKEELEKAQAEAADNHQRFLRAQADLDNFRRRTRQESEVAAKYAVQPLVEKMLPVLDNFERALDAGQQSEQESPLLKGVEMVFRQFKEALASQGLKEIEAEGEKFDPHLHQAVMKEPSAEVDEDVVTEVLQKGYYLQDRVLRPAMVKVSG